MERAATACVEWIVLQKFANREVHIFCGKGNNGGDGLTIGRLLSNLQKKVSVYILDSEKEGSPDFEANLNQLQKLPVNITYIKGESSFPALPNDVAIIDALF